MLFRTLPTIFLQSPKKIVVDIQGVKETNKFVLTDPSVHSTDLKLFGESNLGQEGIDEFFKSHSCNQICRLLKLTKHPLQSKPDEVTETVAREDRLRIF